MLCFVTSSFLLFFLPESKEIFDLIVTLGCGVGPKSVSLLAFLWETLSCGGIDKVIDTEPGSAQEFKIKVKIDTHISGINGNLFVMV